MANIQQLLNDEIRRLARKEVIRIEKEFKTQLVELRKSVSDLTRKVKTLEKALSNQTPATAKTQEPAAEAESKSVRVTPERITKWRTQMGLKRVQYAKLLDVSQLSVSHWERGIATPREAQKQRIAQLRDLGKRQLYKLCEEKGIVLKKKDSAAE